MCRLIKFQIKKQLENGNSNKQKRRIYKPTNLIVHHIKINETYRLVLVVGSVANVNTIRIRDNYSIGGNIHKQI